MNGLLMLAYQMAAEEKEFAPPKESQSEITANELSKNDENSDSPVLEYYSKADEIAEQPEAELDLAQDGHGNYYQIIAETADEEYWSTSDQIFCIVHYCSLFVFCCFGCLIACGKTLYDTERRW